MPDRTPALTPEEIQFIANAMRPRQEEIARREAGVRRAERRRPPLQWWRHADLITFEQEPTELSFPVGRVRLGHDDQVDATALAFQAMQAADEADLEPIFHSPSRNHMPQPLTLRGQPLGHLLTDEDVAMLANAAVSITELRANDTGFSTTLVRLQGVLEENAALLGTVDSQARQMAAMGERLHLLEQSSAATRRIIEEITTMVRSVVPEGRIAAATAPAVPVQPVGPVAARGGPAAGTGSAGAAPAAPTAPAPAASVGAHVPVAPVAAAAHPAGVGGGVAGVAASPARPAVGASAVAPAAPVAGTSGSSPAPAGAGPAVARDVTVEALRTALTTFSQRNGLERARTIIAQFGGASTISGVPAARRQAVLDALSAPIEAPAVA